MKKIGIVTYYKIYNYGSVLQAHALSSKISELGYEVEIIDYLDNHQKCFSVIKQNTYKNRLLTSLKSPLLLISTIKSKMKGDKFISGISQVQKEMFNDYILKYLKLSKVDILKDTDYYSGFVCGSDQIWQISAPGLHELYYLRFCKPEQRIAYAPSFGSLTIPWYNKTRLKKYLSEFSDLSAREQSGKNIIKELLDVEIPRVLDPVLLVENNFWRKFTKEKNKKYIAGYFLGDISNYIDYVKKIEYEIGAKLIFIECGTNQCLDREYVLLNPEDFVDFIANADYVLTDSLHGTEFAIVFEKDFMVLKRNYITVPEQSTRLESLLEMLHLEERYIKCDCIEQNVLEKISYDKVNEILTMERKVSNSYLIEALGKI